MDIDTRKQTIIKLCITFLLLKFCEILGTLNLIIRFYLWPRFLFLQIPTQYLFSFFNKP